MVQISMHLTDAENTGDCTSVPGNFPQRGDGETFQERFKSRRISRDSENTRDHTSFPGNYSQRGDGGTFRERFRSRRISRNPENTGDHTFTSGKLPAAGRWKNIPGTVRISSQSHSVSNIVMDLSAGEGDDSTLDVNTSALRQKIRREGSGKLPSRGRWGNVLGKVQISLHLTFVCKHGRLHVSSRKLPATGRWKNIPGNGSNLDASHRTLRTREITRQFQETSRSGAMEKRSRKGSNLTEISQAAKHGRSNVSSWKLPATGRWRNFPGKVQITMHLTICQTWEIKRQFQETSRNGAMEDTSGKGSNLAAMSPPAKHGRSHVSSRKLPATGRWKILPGKV